MPPPGLRRAAAPLAAVVLALAASPAAAQSGGSAPSAGAPRSSEDPRPAGVCSPSRTPRLRCPDLIMRLPYNGYYRRSGARVLYHAANSIVNLGQGPAELYGYRSGLTGPMRAAQRIYGVDGRRYSFAAPATRVVFKYIPRQGPYWKWESAARFELWSVDSRGRRKDMVRTGPKLIYCLRDLVKRRFLPFAPASRRYPACSQDARRRSVTLGTSVGWADEYPASYHEQYIDVTGLRGRYIFVQRVDPLDGMRESDEDNNLSPEVVLNLPPPAPSPAPRRPGY